MARPKKLPTQEQLDAELAGLKRYNSTRTCMRGHVGAERFLANDGCCACHDEKRGRPWAGQTVADKHTPSRLAWLAHRAEVRRANREAKKQPFNPFAARAAADLSIYRQMPDRLELRNTSTSADIRVSVQSPEHDESGRPTGSWNQPNAESCVLPAQTGFSMLHEKRRLVLETSSPDEILIALTNPSLTNTLKVLTATKKGGATPVGFIGPRRNGISADGINVALSAKQSVLVQQMPQ